VTERIFVRQLDENQWQWRILGGDNRWLDDPHSGDAELLAETLAVPNLPACLIVPGHQVVARKMPVEGVEKKHLDKLLPYEMEEQLIDAVEDLHFCIGDVGDDDEAELIYLTTDYLNNVLSAVNALGADIQHIYPDYLLLEKDALAGTLLLDGELVIGRFGASKGFSIEINVAPYVIEEHVRGALSPSPLRLVASNVEEVETLKSCLPEVNEDESTLELDEQLGHYWDNIDPGLVFSPMNMRRGAFSRQLPFGRWWGLWKKSCYVVAAAFVVALVVNFGEYMVAKSEGKAIRKQMEQVYLQAVPNGRKGDEERRLKTMLKGSGGAKLSEPTNLVLLLGGLAESMAQQKDIKLSNFRYNGEQLELQVNIEVKGLGELGQFREKLTANGLETGSPRTSKQGNIYQANMKITEKR